MKIKAQHNPKRLFMLMLVMMLLLTTFAPGLAEARSEAKAGTLTAVKGEVFVKKGGGKKEIKAFEGMGVTQGDSVRTGKNSSVKVVLDENNETLLGASTQILISELVGNNTAIKQSSGGLWNKVKGTLGAGDSYEVETPTSIMGVRGTLFLVQAGGDGRTTLSVLDGIVGMNRPSSGSSSTEQAVGVDEQVSTGSSSTIPTPSPLDIPQFVQETDVNILVQIILDELESAQNREQRAAEYERLYESLNLPDHLTGAVEEAHLASLLAHIADAIMREIEQSTRYTEVEQAFRDQGINWEETYREARNRVEQTERRKAELERIAERERILQERQNQLRQELQNKIDRHRSGQSTSPSTTSPTTPPSSGGGGGGGGSTPQTGTPVTATFINNRAEASGTFNGISYTISIPRKTNDEDTISFTLQNPPSGIIPAGVGPIHALDISGLDGRKVELTLSIPEGLSDPQAYHHEGNGRWEARGTEPHDDGKSVTFVTELSAVAVAAKIPTLGLEADAEPINQGQQYSVELAWSEIEMEGVGYKLYRSSTTNPNPVEIWSMADYTVNKYTDTVDAGETYTYTVRAVRHGFESMPSEVEVPAPTVGRITGTVNSIDVWNDYTKQPMSSLMVRVWDTEREELIAAGSTNSMGEYEIYVPVGGPYRITVANDNNHIYELYYDDYQNEYEAETDFFVRYHEFDDTDLYTFSVSKNANIPIPDFSIILYEDVEIPQGYVYHNYAKIEWNPYVDSNLNGYLILKNGKYVDYIENVNETTYTFEGLVPEMPYEFGIAAWGGDYALAIGSMNITTAPLPVQLGTVTGQVRDLSTPDGEYLSGIKIKVWEVDRERMIASGTTDNGEYSIPVPVGGSYRITAEFIEEPGHAFEIYNVNQQNKAVADLFLKHEGLANSEPYAFSVAEEGADTSIPDFYIVPYDRIENLSAEVSDRHFKVTWEPHSDASRHTVYIYGTEYSSANGGYTASAQANQTYDFGVAAWQGSFPFPLAIGLIEFTTDPYLAGTGTVTGAVYSEKDGYLADIPVKIWNQGRTTLLKEGTTNLDGEFLITGVPVGNNYRLTAEYQGQAYEMYGEDDTPYTFSVQEYATTPVEEIFISFDPDEDPPEQITNLEVTAVTDRTISIAWDPYDPYPAPSFSGYRVLVNGSEVGYVDADDPAPSFTIEAANGYWDWNDEGKWELTPDTYYEIGIGAWTSDWAVAFATIFAKTDPAP